MTDGVIYNTLLEPLFRVRGTDANSVEGFTLPGVLASYSRGESLQPLALRPHQAHAWHAFVVQLAAIALLRAGHTEPYLNEEEWLRALRALVEGDEAFSLVVSDLSKSAFMQPPVPEKSLAGFKRKETSADAIDVLITGRNHDLKAQRISAADPCLWLLALISLQTQEGFSGRGNYGIVRMNGGYGSRPEVTLLPSSGTCFLRDVGLWLERVNRIAEAFGYDPDGHALLWCLPWDGKSSIRLQQCMPAFIDVARRVRIVANMDSLEARLCPTTVARVDQEQKGDTGDIWTPIRKSDLAALSISGAGPTYGKIADWVFGADWMRNPTIEPMAGEKIHGIRVRGLARGQGKTDGWHERILPFPGNLRRGFRRPETRQLLGKLSKARVEQVGEFKKRCLKPALLAFVQGAPDDLNFKDRSADQWLAGFESAVDEVFFEHLFVDVDRPELERQCSWESILRDLGRMSLDFAISQAPCPAARRLRATARAQILFAGACRRLLKSLSSAGSGSPEGPGAGFSQTPKSNPEGPSQLGLPTFGDSD